MASLREWTKRLSLAAGFALAGLSGAAADDVRDDVFRIGMVVAGAPVVEGLTAIQALFSQALGSSVEVVAARDYEALIRGQIDRRIDYAIYSATAYAAASLRCGCVEPVVSPVGAAGTIGLRSILVQKPGAIPARIAIGPRDSLAGNLAPLALWPDAAEAGRRDALVPAESLASAEAMFIDGRVDAFFGWALALPGDGENLSGGTPARLQAAGLGQGDYEIAWRSDMLRFGPHAVRADIPADRRERLQRLLVDGSDPAIPAYLANHYGGGFVAAAQGDYAAVIEAVAGLSRDDPAR